MIDARAKRSPELPGFSPWLCDLFTRYVRRRFAREFNAVRTSGSFDLQRIDGPLIVYSNHPSWWDPIHFRLLGSRVCPKRRMYGPMDAEALEKYRFFKKLGVFGIERSRRRGAVTFLRTGLAVLGRSDSSLWLTAEGVFADPRRRPVRLQPGLAHLLQRRPRATVVPLAVEYPFWTESRPEALSRFGEWIRVDRHSDLSTREWTGLLRSRLESTMDALALSVQERDPAGFRTLVRGKPAVSPVYDAWRRTRALAGGRAFTAAHGDESR